MDKAAIFTDLTCRNALRKAHGLPLLDIRAEYAHQIWIAKQRDYRAICDEHADEREAIRRQVLAEYRARPGADFGSGMGGRLVVGLRTNKRFAIHLGLRYGVWPP